MWPPYWKERLLHVVMPRTCLSCGKDLYPLSTGPLCGDCLLKARPAAPPRCRRCSARWEGPEPLCRRCRSRLFSVELIRAGFRYEAPMPALIRAFKFRDDRAARGLLTGWMAGLWRRYPELAGTDALIPVPLHPGRRRRRGFNQAELLAQALSRTARVPVLDVLEKTAASRPQRLLDRRARETRQLGLFLVPAGAVVRGLRLTLIDDVCTTGGTLESCGLALRKAGARDVRAFVLAVSDAH